MLPTTSSSQTDDFIASLNDGSSQDQETRAQRVAGLREVARGEYEKLWPRRSEERFPNYDTVNQANQSQNEREMARTAWQSRFGERHVSIPRGSPDLFITGRRLGGGGVGIVHETLLDGIHLALKRTYCRKLTEDQLNEIKVLGKISEQRHHHIVELVGSYVHRQRSAYELGLLIWPVAYCDLATLLHDLWHVVDCCSLDSARDTALDDDDNDLVSALETLSRLLGIESTGVSATFAKDVIEGINSRLTNSIGCIAEAVAFIHGQGIRHKDLKPSQVLLSPHGLWLTDFGWSNDMSEFSHSTTSGWDRVTAKYQAPERANNQPCGRSEDVFALGCIFMEMSAVLLYPSPVHSSEHIWHQKGWSYHASLSGVKQVLYRSFETYRTYLAKDDPECRLLRTLIGMLSAVPKNRPTISQVLQVLSGPPKASFGGFFSPCCGRQSRTVTPSKQV
jgi:serine/threonine protein kinase